MNLRLVGVLSLVVSVSGCTGEGAAGERPGPVQPQAERIVSFVATPSEPAPGDPVELSWETEGPEGMRVELVGFGEVERTGSVVVHPWEDQSWILRIGDWATEGTLKVRVAKVRMRAALSPAGGVIAPGQRQTFTIPGIAGPFAWSTSGGWFGTDSATVTAMEGPEAIWRAPTEPGVYEIQAIAPDGRTARSSIEVRALPGSVERLTGLGGQGPADLQLLRAPSGDLFSARNTGFVLRWRAQTGEWTVVARGEQRGLRLALAPDGTLWGYNQEALLRYDEASDSWSEEAVPPGAIETVLADRTWLYLVGSRGRSLFARPVSGGEWVELPGETEAVVDAAVDSAGALWAMMQRNGSRLVGRWLPASGVWEEDRPQVEQMLHRLHVGGDGTLYTFGEGLRRLLPGADAWVDISEGLFEGCSGVTCEVVGLVERGGRLVAATRGGIFVREEAGPFVRTSDSPSPSGFPFRLYDDGAGGLLTADHAGLWHQPAGSTGWQPFFGQRGMPADAFVSRMAVDADGTLVAATSAFEPDFVPLYRRAPDGSWAPLARNLERQTYEMAVGPVFLPDGRLLFAFAGALYQVARGADVAEPAALPPLDRVVQFGGSAEVLVALADDRLYRFVAGSDAWEPIPFAPGAFSFPVVTGSTVVTSSSVGPVALDDSGAWQPLGGGGPTEMIFDVARGPDGALWIAGDRGTWRLHGERWTRVGLGGCAELAYSLVLRADGRAFCDSGRQLVELDETGAWVPVHAFARPWHLASFTDGRILAAFDGTGIFAVH